MDMRIRSLDVNVRQRLDDVSKIEKRLEDMNNEERLIAQIKNEVYIHGDTFLELTASELLKSVEFSLKRLDEELKYARDWEFTKRDADVLRSEVTALMKQATICKVAELSNRAAKQIQKIELIMRATSETVKMPRIYKVSERSNSDNRLVGMKKHRSYQQNLSQRPYKQAFLTSSTPTTAFDSSHHPGTPRSRHKVGLVNRNQSYRRPMLRNHSDDTKLQYIDTVELDLSSVIPTSVSRGDQSDRLTLNSVSSSTIAALSE